MKHGIALLSVILAGLFSSACAARELKTQPIPLGFGVSAHGLGSNFEELDAVKEAGFRIVRRDLLWDVVEKQRGVYSWDYTDRFAQKLQSLGLRPLFILVYSNNLYTQEVVVRKQDGGTIKKAAAPSSYSEIQAFSRFASAAVERYKKYDPIWEIWNEPEHDGFWPPKANPVAFSSLANITCSAMRRVDPDATIVAPGAAEKPTYKQPTPPLLDEMMRGGILNCLDGVSVHPYLWASEIDSTPEIWASLRQLIEKKAIPQSGKKLPAPVNSEWGLSTYSGRISEETQAAYLVKMMLLNMASDVPVSIWYDWKDDGDDPDNPEHHYGVMRQDGKTPKPAWHAMKFLTRELEGFRYYCTKADNNATQVTLVFNSEYPQEQWRMVVWGKKNGTRAELNLPASVRVNKVFSVSGDQESFTVNAGKYGLNLTTAPLFVELSSVSKEDKGLLCR